MRGKMTVFSRAQPELTLTSSALTHIGRVRAVNEDRILNRVDRGLFAVADGMGGHKRGDVAADAVIRALGELADGHAPLTDASLSAAIAEANRLIYEGGGAAAGQSGSTVAGLNLNGGWALMFWAGDSRIYRLRSGKLDIMTHDHRVVQDMIDAGLIDVRSAKGHPHAAVITRAVGARPTLSLAVRHETVEAGDTYLLCSDGLTDLVDQDVIAKTILLPQVRAADSLLDAAMAAGGRDNISLILVVVASGPVETCRIPHRPADATAHHG